MSTRDCISKDKHDFPALERAKAVGFPSLNDVIPDLLEWLQDANWPVAQPTASVLADAGREIAPHIKDVLTSEDSVWKYWLIELLFRNLRQNMQLELRSELERLVCRPTRNDRLEEVDALARQVLAEVLP